MAGVQFHWIGSGSGLNPILGNTSFRVLTEGGPALVVDCGFTVGLKLIEHGLIDGANDILVTHCHADHIGGLETLALYHYFVRRNRGSARPRLYVATDDFAHNLWQHSLRGGMDIIIDEDGAVREGRLTDYFDVRTGRVVQIDGLPAAEFVPTRHVAAMENYAVRFGNGVYYSGDTVELPPHDAVAIFQDCQFFDGGPSEVHISYERLARELPPGVKARTYLVHLGMGYADRDPQADGFKGFVLPGDTFTF